MILPNKHIAVDQSYLGMGATLLAELTRPTTLSGLWERIRGTGPQWTYGRFLLALDLLYALGAVDLDRGMLRRTAP